MENRPMAEYGNPVAQPGLPSEQLVTGGLPQVVRPRDLTILSLFAVLLITNIQVLAGAGAVSLLYWLLGFACFLIPSALVCAQLYRLFPGEGAVYLWANRAFGSFWDTFLGFFCNWWPGAIGLTVEVGAVVTSIQGLNGSWLTAPWQQGLVELLILAGAQWLCLLPHRQLQRLLNSAFYAYISLFVLVILASGVWMLGGHSIQADFSAPAWQLNASNYPLFSVVVLALLGMAIPLNMGAEVTHQGAATRYLSWSTLIIIIGYLAATIAVLIILPARDIANPAFLGLLFERVFGPQLGMVFSVACYLILGCYFCCATAAYNILFARLLLVAGIDYRLPRAFRRLNINKVPANATYLQTAMNALFIIVLFFITPQYPRQGLSTTVFLVVMSGAATVWNIAMIGLFLCGIVLCIRYRSYLTRRWVVPPAVFHTAMLLGIIASGIAIYSTFFTGSPIPSVLNNEDWFFWVIAIVLLSLVIGAIYSILVPETEDLVALLQPRQGQQAPQVASQPVPLSPAPPSDQHQQSPTTGPYQHVLVRPRTGQRAQVKETH